MTEIAPNTSRGTQLFMISPGVLLNIAFGTERHPILRREIQHRAIHAFKAFKLIAFFEKFEFWLCREPLPAILAMF